MIEVNGLESVLQAQTESDIARKVLIPQRNPVILTNYPPPREYPVMNLITATLESQNEADQVDVGEGHIPKVTEAQVCARVRKLLFDHNDQDGLMGSGMNINGGMGSGNG
jgi:hypothetical protein